MTFTSEEMIEAAKESASASDMDKETAKVFISGFYSGALWAASKMEEAKRCKILPADILKTYYIGDCENCESTVINDQKYCWNCGCKFKK